MPRLDGMELIKEIQRRRLSVSMIVTTGYGSIDEAVQAIRLGATDFLTKPIDVEHLRRVIDRVLRERALLDEVAHLRLQLETTYTFQNILSKNPRMHAVFELINNVADTNTTVLVEGETGTGKEQVARAIHGAAHARGGPLVAVNCAALPETLLESELFGHEKGAFTGAVGQRPRAASSWLTAARFSWTRSATCRRRCRPSYFAFSRNGRLNASAALNPFRWTCASSPLPTVPCKKMKSRRGQIPLRDLFYRLNSDQRFCCPLCANAPKTFRSWRPISP